MKPFFKTFLLGIATLFDLSGVLTISHPRALSVQSDLEAMRSDWMAVWQDMSSAFQMVTHGAASAEEE